MRYATVTLTWSGRELTPIDEIFGRSDAVSVEAIRYVNPVHDDDERYVELLELRGDLERARTLLADSRDVFEYDVTRSDGHGLAYVQCRSVGLVDDLLSVLREHEIILDWPMRYIETDGTRGLEITAIGTSRAIQRAAADLPDEIRLELERLGEYEPGPDPRATLTERQRELFEVAVREGYYEVPRETTHRELAAKIDLAPSTVGEHLQRIESKLAAAYAGSME
ncbi:DNA-binding protein [Natronococcus pandeyae]|uniref:DNA-binding protein n=1 Tax=Natronococcus pandeyae TaxID=2055836 RepID=A0A8J8Q487_9EURY|nr:helix-turn-helix domain-containing protein [Natronococcus pandeyae]TYL39166.1 DNA-binding protein [Natronococcus pandeyae]